MHTPQITPNFSKLEQQPAGKNILLIIDPQIDFCEGGSLAVPGATKDLTLLANFLTTNPSFFQEIHVSLDSHTETHIGHKGFWRTVDGNLLDETFHYGTVTVKGENIDIVKLSGETVQVQPSDKKYTTFAKKYIEMMHALGATKPKPCIWPSHCIKENNAGWNVYPALATALVGKEVTYHEKGGNDLVEMYSIFSAEVPAETVTNDLEKSANQDIIAEVIAQEAKNYSPQKKVLTMDMDNTNYKTSFNTELFNTLFGKNNQVYICGEAKTHCVKTSIEDLFNHITKQESDKVTTSYDQMYVIDNITSSIPSQTNLTEFSEPMQKSFLAMKGSGVKFVKLNNDSEFVEVNDITDGLQESSGGGKKRRRYKKTRKGKSKKRKRTTYRRRRS